MPSHVPHQKRIKKVYKKRKAFRMNNVNSAEWKILQGILEWKGGLFSLLTKSIGILVTNSIEQSP
jgi:hypothetical protein